MKMKATFTVECEADNGPTSRYFLEQALPRARKALMESIEKGVPGGAAKTGIRPNSTKIDVKSIIE
jgi:hypothetical protein